MKQNLYLSLYKWYESNKRALPWRETQDGYAIWVSEIILQQTRVEQGLPYYMRFINRFPDVHSLASAQEDEVMLLWQGLGYYSRARNLYKGAQQIVAQYTNKEQRDFPSTFEQLRQIPGVGDYTAGAIASFAYNLPYPALDGNVYRVLARLFDCDIAFDTSAGKKYFHHLAENLLDQNNPRLFNSAIMEFGALFCTPTSPDCPRCPLQGMCKGYANNTVDLLPVRKPRPKIKDRFLNYCIYICKGQTLLHQRTKKDIWQHLYEFPLEESDHLYEKEHFFAISHPSKSMDFTHILSHQRLHARFFVLPCNQLPAIEATFAVEIKHLGDYACSRLMEKAIEHLLL